MAKPRKAGKRLFEFTLFGKMWDVREVPIKHPRLRDKDSPHGAWGAVYYNENTVYIARAEDATLEQQQTAILHEIQHIIEEHYAIDHKIPSFTTDDLETRVDRISLGWLYVIRGCPEVIAFVTRGEVLV